MVPACPPTAVDHCVEARLTSCAETNLVIARATVLEVYTLREQHQPAGAGTAAQGLAGTGGGPPANNTRKHLDGVSGAFLALTAHASLNGTVEAMCVVQQQPRDLLLLAFADAKISIIDFDPASQSLRTRAVHSFDPVGDAIGCQHVPRPLLSVGADCAALLGFGSHLFVLPLRADGTFASGTGDAAHVPPPAAQLAADGVVGSASPGDAPGGGGGGGGGTCWFRESLAALGLHHVRDMGFLHSSLEPTLAL
eukprot:6810750-Prymnesium_polylepis.1